MFSRVFKKPVSRIVVGARSFSSTNGNGGLGLAMPVSLVALAGAGYCYYDVSNQQADLERKLNDIQIQQSGKTNMAYLFIK